MDIISQAMSENSDAVNEKKFDIFGNSHTK
jgi:hypothetical protein